MKQPFLAARPPMGWNSWNTFHEHLNEDLIQSTADAMLSQGLPDLGYQYLVIDDCWALRERDAQGNLVPDPQKFPRGIRALADDIHRRGLKLGLYSCCGVRTCAGYPGSFEHEFADASLFAEWGIDYLKYDNCYRPQSLGTPTLYRRMAMALRTCGREILLAACQWGTEDVYHWIRSAGAQTFRSTVDIQDSWQSIQTIALEQMEKQPFSGPGCFNDMDMLVVGLYGKSLNPEVNVGGCTDEEYQTHFALWAMLNSPLMIGCDVREMREATKAILKNRDVIALNQDPECRGAYKLPVYGNPDAFVLVKPLAGGAYGVGFFNFGDVEAKTTLDFWDMGLPTATGLGLSFYDCLTHQEVGLKRECYAPVVPAHGCLVYRCTVKGAIL